MLLASLTILLSQQDLLSEFILPIYVDVFTVHVQPKLLFSFSFGKSREGLNPLLFRALKDFPQLKLAIYQ